MKQFRWLTALVVGAFLMAACGGMQAAVDDSGEIARSATVPPVFVAGSPFCTDLGFDFELKIDSLVDGTYSFPAPLGAFQVVFSIDGVYFDWASTIPVAAVIAKGGPNANVYYYDPASLGDKGLVSPINPSNGQPYNLSHASFCVDLETVLRSTVLVTKTADTEVDRDWTWEIEKVGDQTELTLSVGQTFLVNYDVTVSGTFLDTPTLISGTITVKNDGPLGPVSVTKPVDEIAPNEDADVNCGALEFPYELAVGAEFQCTYTYAVDPDDLDFPTSGVNIASVDVSFTNTITNEVVTVTNEGVKAWDFANATIDNETDECVNVTDDKYGVLGIVCANQLVGGEFTFEYSLDIRYDACAAYEFVNVASFVTNDTGASGSDDHAVVVDVPCVGGCTLTQGYWKTHSEYGPAPYDDTWAMVPDGANTVFFLSDQSWYQVFWTAPAGNVYYVLARQYMAARLSILNGADSTPAVDAALAAAMARFNTDTPAQVATLRGAARNAIIDLARTLDAYNNGLIGPGHCSE